jgi:hypothetical protein
MSYQSPPPTAAQFAEVIVDTQTGEIAVERLLMLVDCGRVINPLTAAGQVEGGMAQVHIQTLLNLSEIRPDQKTMLFLESGHLALGQGDLVEAGSLFLEAIQELLCSIMWFRHVAPMFDGVALLALKKGEMASAARLFGNRWCRGYAHYLSPIEKDWRQPDWDAMQTALGDDQFERIYESGRSMTFKDTVDLAMEIVSQDRK